MCNSPAQQQRVTGMRMQSSCWDTQQHTLGTHICFHGNSIIRSPRSRVTLFLPTPAPRNGFKKPLRLLPRATGPSLCPQVCHLMCCPCRMSPLSIFPSVLLWQRVIAEGADRSGAEGIIAGNNGCSKSSLLATLCFNQTCTVWRDRSPVNSPPVLRLKSVSRALRAFLTAVVFAS